MQASDGYLNASDTFFIDLFIEPIQYLKNDESNNIQNQFEMYEKENSIKVGRNFSLEIKSGMFKNEENLIYGAQLRWG